MNNPQEKFEAFKVELKALLAKYDACISCGIDGDTHGLLTTMEVGFKVNPNTWKTDDFTLTHTTEIEAGDIK